jgi:hypothetical protein
MSIGRVKGRYSDVAIFRCLAFFEHRIVAIFRCLSRSLEHYDL